MAAKYILLAEELIADIEKGRLVFGQKMPSIREFSTLYGVSKTTTLGCYYRLQDQGWLVSKAQSGFYVSQPFGKQTNLPYPNFKSAISQPKSVQTITNAKNSPFYVSLISPELIPHKALIRCFKQGNKKSDNFLHLYPDYQGEIALREVLALHFSTQYFSLEASQLVITNGCIDAIKTAIEITTRPGDTIAISSPCFSGLIELLANLERMVIEIPFFQSKLDLKQLEHHLKNKSVQCCLLSANHINPQGMCLAPEQKQKIAELANIYKIPVIEDDVYLELTHSKLSPLPIKYWDKNGWVLWCSSISKTISPSYRLGWCHPGRYFELYLKHRRVQYLGMNSFIQNAIGEFIYSGHYLKHLKKIRLSLSQQMLCYHSLLKKYLPKNANISTPEGGLVIWVQVEGLNSELLLNKTKVFGVYFRPGNQFSTLDLYRDCFRINAGWPISGDKESNAKAYQNHGDLIKLCKLVCEQIS